MSAIAPRHLLTLLGPAAARGAPDNEHQPGEGAVGRLSVLIVDHGERPVNNADTRPPGRAPVAIHLSGHGLPTSDCGMPLWERLKGWPWSG